MSERDVRDYLEDIVIQISKIETFVSHIDNVEGFLLFIPILQSSHSNPFNCSCRTIRADNDQTYMHLKHFRKDEERMSRKKKDFCKIMY